MELDGGYSSFWLLSLSVIVLMFSVMLSHVSKPLPLLGVNHSPFSQFTCRWTLGRFQVSFTHKAAVNLCVREFTRVCVDKRFRLSWVNS